MDSQNPIIINETMNNDNGNEIIWLKSIWDLYTRHKNDTGEFIDKASCKVCKNVVKTTGGNTCTLRSHAKRHKYDSPKRNTGKRKNTGEIIGTFFTINCNVH